MSKKSNDFKLTNEQIDRLVHGNENGMGSFIGLIFIIAIIIGMVLWTDRNLDYVCTLIKGTNVDVPIWLSAIAALLTNGLAFIFNIIMEIVRFVI